MKIEYGSSRIAFIGQKNVFKLPYYKFSEHENLKFSYGAKKNLNILIKKIKYFFEQSKYSIQKSLIEYQNSKKHKKFLAKTNFSLFGILNIQTKLQTLTNHLPNGRIDSSSIFKKLKNSKFYNIITTDYKELNHTLFYDRNYGTNENGEIMLIDGGEQKLNDFLGKYGKEFFEFLNQK